MKTATRILVCLLVVLFLQLSLAYAAAPLAGKWVNIDANTNSITRLEVTKGADGWVIHAWGKCGPPDCDWGTTPLHMAVDSDGPDQPVDVQRLTHGVAYWDHKEKDAKADLPPLNVATFRERISGGGNQGRARDATRKEVHCGADHWEAPRG
jgi:hypothetical protein